MASSDVYQIVTDRMISKLEGGEIPWRKSWQTDERLPMNLISGKQYQGINTILLWSMRYSSPYWLTYRQAQELGGNVRKGEKSTPVVFWKFLEKEEDGKIVQIPMAKYYSAFNLSQCEGIPEEKIPSHSLERREFTPIEEAQRLIDGMQARPQIGYGATFAAYYPSLDLVRMPDPELFDSPEEFYSTLFHELIHSTGHQSRLNRSGIAGEEKTRTDYGREELIAEMGAAFLNAICGISAKVEENSAAYLAGWLKLLREDSRAVIVAAGAAQKAANFIRGPVLVNDAQEEIATA